MLVARAGDIILQSGAEIFRVETTMSHMAKALHVEDLETYVIANGIFATAKGEGAQLHAHIKSVETGDTDLGKIEAVNELSRDMEQHAYTLEDVEKRLEEIENMGEYPRFILISAYGMGAGCFCYAFGGSFHDSQFQKYEGTQDHCREYAGDVSVLLYVPAGTGRQRGFYHDRQSDAHDPRCVVCQFYPGFCGK